MQENRKYAHSRGKHDDNSDADIIGDVSTPEEEIEASLQFLK